jgi:uridine nucleosidase
LELIVIWVQVPVAEGSHKSLRGSIKEHLADFVHGSDGFGNTAQPLPTGSASDLSAAEFTVRMARQYPGQITYLALASLTNLALAFHLDPQLVDNLVRRDGISLGRGRALQGLNPP